MQFSKLGFNNMKFVWHFLNRLACMFDFLRFTQLTSVSYQENDEILFEGLTSWLRLQMENKLSVATLNWTPLC